VELAVAFVEELGASVEVFVDEFEVVFEKTELFMVGRMSVDELPSPVRYCSNASLVRFEEWFAKLLLLRVEFSSSATTVELASVLAVEF